MARAAFRMTSAHDFVARAILLNMNSACEPSAEIVRARYAGKSCVF